MNVVIWARVSSREQSEGYSLDAQIRINRDKAQREGWTVIREFVIAESARRGATRIAFNEMYRWVKKNAKRLKIGAVLAHKLDRICRNMRDAVRLQELEDDCGVQLAFVENQFGPGAAGALSFNVIRASRARPSPTSSTIGSTSGNSSATAASTRASTGWSSTGRPLTSAGISCRAGTAARGAQSTRSRAGSSAAATAGRP